MASEKLKIIKNGQDWLLGSIPPFETPTFNLGDWAENSQVLHSWSLHTLWDYGLAYSYSVLTYQSKWTTVYFSCAVPISKEGKDLTESERKEVVALLYTLGRGYSSTYHNLRVVMDAPRIFSILVKTPGSMLETLERILEKGKTQFLDESNSN